MIQREDLAARRFDRVYTYVNILGFEKHADIPFSDGMRWFEVGPEGAPTGIALVLPREGQQASPYETGLILTVVQNG